MGLLDAINTLLIGILNIGRSEETIKKNRDAYLKNHSGLKKKQKEVEEAWKKADDSWAKAMSHFDDEDDDKLV